MDTWFKAIRLFPFFYDKRYDEERAIQLLRWLVRSKKEIDTWLFYDSNFPKVLIRLMALLLKSVGSIQFQSEYGLNIGILKLMHREFDLLMVEFLGQHIFVLDHLVPSPHDLFHTLAGLTIKMVM